MVLIKNNALKSCPEQRSHPALQDVSAASFLFSPAHRAGTWELSIVQRMSHRWILWMLSLGMVTLQPGACIIAQTDGRISFARGTVLDVAMEPG